MPCPPTYPGGGTDDVAHGWEDDGVPVANGGTAVCGRLEVVLNELVPGAVGRDGGDDMAEEEACVDRLGGNVPGGSVPCVNMPANGREEESGTGMSEPICSCCSPFDKDLSAGSTGVDSVAQTDDGVHAQKPGSAWAPDADGRAVAKEAGNPERGNPSEEHVVGKD